MASLPVIYGFVIILSCANFKQFKQDEWGGARLCFYNSHWQSEVDRGYISPKVSLMSAVFSGLYHKLWISCVLCFTSRTLLFNVCVEWFLKKESVHIFLLFTFWTQCMKPFFSLKICLRYFLSRLMFCWLVCDPVITNHVICASQWVLTCAISSSHHLVLCYFWFLHFRSQWLRQFSFWLLYHLSSRVSLRSHDPFLSLLQLWVIFFLPHFVQIAYLIWFLLPPGDVPFSHPAVWWWTYSNRWQQSGGDTHGDRDREHV